MNRRRKLPGKDFGIGMEPIGRCGHDDARGIGRRQTLLGAGLAIAALSAGGSVFAATMQMPPLPEDEHFMRMAIAEAAQADFPFGAVIVRDREVLAKGRNLGKTTNDPTAHGEMVAIRRFVSVHAAAELAGSTLYTSGEPCAMCMGAILWCGIGRLVFAASVDELSTKIDREPKPPCT